MLYVFHVEAGRMLTMDMKLAVEQVSQLKEAIMRHYGIPVELQVLLISGGACLRDDARVAKYAAGTDTNPIFMFIKTAKELRQGAPVDFPWPSEIESGGHDKDTELEKQVLWCLQQPATYQTLVNRNQKAQRLYEIAREDFAAMQKIVNDQHLQHQGWCAVVANLDDITRDFEERSEAFFRVFDEHLENKKEYWSYLNRLEESLERLSKIPLLPGLIEFAEESNQTVIDEMCSKDSETSVSKQETTEDEYVENDHPKTLLQWIADEKNLQWFQASAGEVRKELDRFNENELTRLRQAVKNLMLQLRAPEFLEIKGISSRLASLEDTIQKATKLLKEQKDHSQAFHQNQMRAADLADASVLSDLSDMHKTQMNEMLTAYTKLNEFRTRCARAKDELSANLYQRVIFITKVQERVFNSDNEMLFMLSSIRRIRGNITIFEQICQAPSLYVCAVREVVRRKEYSKAFSSWASGLSSHMITTYNDELLRRQEFAASFNGHFLCNLFPGMNDVPPSYATEQPSEFDSSLPKISKKDADELSKQFPEYIENSIFLEDMEPVIRFFIESRISNQNIIQTTSQEKASLTQMETTQMLKPPEMHAHLKDLEKGFESETDTEEFEKVSQSPVDRRSTVNVQNASQINPSVILPTTIKPEMVTISTSTLYVETKSVEVLTDETFEATQSEITRLKSLLCQMQGKSLEQIVFLRRELDQTKQEIDAARSSYKEEIARLQSAIIQMEEEAKNRERELTQRLTVDHELELDEVRKNLLRKEEELNTIRQEKELLEAGHTDVIAQHESEKCLLRDDLERMAEELKETQKALELAEAGKEQAVAEAREKLIREHKNEFEAMRSRMRMMTSVDRSPSDTSLEKIERPDMIDMVSHEIIVAQIREEMQKEREQAVALAIEQERAAMQQESAKTLQPESPSQCPNMMKRMLDERGKQLEMIRAKENEMAKENMKLKDRIQSLVDSDVPGSLKDELDLLRTEKNAFEEKLEAEKQKRKNIERKLSCQVGDCVRVVWSPALKQYTILTDYSPRLFLHEQSYTTLGLPSQIPPNTLPPVIELKAYVHQKEYCHALKTINRYKVQKGVKFYRVKVGLTPPITKGDIITESIMAASTSSGSNQPITTTATTNTISTLLLSSSTSTTMDSTIIASTRSTTTATTTMIDSCAQTDLEPLLEVESNDMVDSGVSEQQKSLLGSGRTTSEEIVTQLDEAAALDTNDEADGVDLIGGIQVLSSSNLQCGIQSSTTSTSNFSRLDVDDTSSLSDDYQSLDTKTDEKIIL